MPLHLGAQRGREGALGRAEAQRAVLDAQLDAALPELLNERGDQMLPSSISSASSPCSPSSLAISCACSMRLDSAAIVGQSNTA